MFERWKKVSGCGLKEIGARIKVRVPRSKKTGLRTEGCDAGNKSVVNSAIRILDWEKCSSKGYSDAQSKQALPSRTCLAYHPTLP